MDPRFPVRWCGWNGKSQWTAYDDRGEVIKDFGIEQSKKQYGQPRMKAADLKCMTLLCERSKGVLGDSGDYVSKGNSFSNWLLWG